MTQVRERTSPHFIVGETPPPSPDRYWLLLHPLCDTGNPDFNPFLVDQLDISDAAKYLCKSNRYSSHYEPAFQLLLNGRAAEGFWNVIRHQVLTARFVEAQMRMMNKPYEEEASIIAAALIHDCDTPMHKLEAA